MARFILATLLTAAMLLAGCSSGADSGGSEPDETPDDRDREPTPGSPPGTPPATPGSPRDNPGTGSNGTDNVTYEWRTTYANGTMTPGAAPVLDPPTAVEEGVSVDAKAVDLWLNITAEDAAIVVDIMPPSCTEESCAEREEVPEGSEAQLNFAAPEPGEWTIRLTWDGDEMVLATESSYGIQAAQKVEVATPGNATTAS